MKVTLPDGKELELPDGATGLDAARAIGPKLAEQAVLVRVDGQVQDLRLPLADGRFHLRVALIDPESGRPLHALDDALRLFVFPDGPSAGALLFEGDWTMKETGPGAPIGRS